MGGISKSFSLLLILILAVSILTMVKPVFAQSNDANDMIVPPPNGDNIPTPSIPEFTVHVVDSSNFEVIITNQPFTPFNDSHGNPVQFVYSVRVGLLTALVNSDNWTELYDADGGYIAQSSIQTTTISINLADGNHEYGESTPIPVGSQFFVEVEAIIGYYGRDAAYGPLLLTWFMVKQAGGANPKQ